MKNTMKKLLASVLAVMMVVSIVMIFASCEDKPTNTTAEATTAATQATESTAPERVVEVFEGNFTYKD
ncbi:MAG: hypothetical protein IKI51_04165, partial [Clostridia bacterium]|nr:hypothetical protein [Clostridia bacterium]